MVGGRIAKRYAKALVAMGQAAGNEAALARDVQRFRELFEASDDLRAVLTNPTVAMARREAVLLAVLDRFEAMDIHARNFLRLLLRKGRIAHVGSVSQAFLDMLDELAGRVRANVTSAVPMDAEGQARLRKALEKLFGKTVAVEHRVDPAILGGAVTQVGHVIYDGSLRSQFERIRDHLVVEN